MNTLELYFRNGLKLVFYKVKSFETDWSHVDAKFVGWSLTWEDEKAARACHFDITELIAWRMI